MVTMTPCKLLLYHTDNGLLDTYILLGSLNEVTCSSPKILSPTVNKEMFRDVITHTMGGIVGYVHYVLYCTVGMYIIIINLVCYFLRRLSIYTKQNKTTVSVSIPV